MRTAWFAYRWLPLVASVTTVVGCRHELAPIGIADGLRDAVICSVGPTAQEVAKTGSVPDFVAQVRMAIEEKICDGGTKDVFFEKLPQGLRMFSGVRSSDICQLRNGIITVTAFVPDSLDTNHSFEELRRVVSRLAELTGPDGELDDPNLRVKAHPQSLYIDIKKRLDAAEPMPITVVTLSIPFLGNGGDRSVRSIAAYWSGSWIGVDEIDSLEQGHELGHDFVGGLGLVASYPFACISAVNEFLFIDATWFDSSIPIASFINAPVSVSAQSIVAAKEISFEVVKSIFAGFASLIATDANWTRFCESAKQPYRSIGDIANYHGAIMRDSSYCHSPLKSLDVLLSAIPLVGNYMPHYFDDPWSQFSSAEPRRNFTTEPVGDSARASLNVFCSRGVHGAGVHQQGNELWVASLRETLCCDSLKRVGFGISDVPSTNVQDVPYAWGTFLDPVFSYLNFSSGYAYTLALGVESSLEDQCSMSFTNNDIPVVSFVAHSGGVQRVTIASRLLWNRDIFTDTIYGVAGPSTGYAPVKPGQNHVFLSKSEYQDSDFTSRVSSLMADIEGTVLKVMEIPIVGPMWNLSVWSRGVPQSYSNADIARIDGRASMVHRNPGKTTSDRRDISLTFFRDDVCAILAEKLLLRAGIDKQRAAQGCR